MPLATLTLLQGLGRLIRTRSDAEFLRCSTQLTRMSYGRRFLASFPPAPLTDDLGDVSRFLGGRPLTGILWAMKKVFRAPLVAAMFATGLLWSPQPFAAAPRLHTAVATSPLPAKRTSEEFWKLTNDISEPGGYFRITDNYTSNENEIGQIFTMLRQQGKTGGVYIGVGPEQNLTYIAAIKPAMAFVIDIRRQAVMQHLMFKAMFEMSKDRADFISLLFARPPRRAR